MAFKSQKIEPVEFGDFTVMPKMTAENILRLKQLRSETAKIEEIRDVLANCFDDEADRVRDFMRNHFFESDYSRLMVYLMQGDRGLQAYDRRLETIMEETAKEAVKEALEARKEANDV